jgi:hypothetical protein
MDFGNANARVGTLRMETPTVSKRRSDTKAVAIAIRRMFLVIRYAAPLHWIAIERVTP